jgi:exodeoxyribonuclease-3
MKLMTYNILNGAQEQFETIIQVVNGQAPDFLTINETNGFDLNDNQTLREFAGKTGFPYFDLALCGDGADYHVAVLSKYPFEHIKHLDGFARAAIAVTLKADLGTMSIIGAHLTPYTEAARLDEIDAIIAYQKPFANRVIMGDLNSLSPADNYDPTMIFAFNAMQTKKFTAKERLLFDATTKLIAAGYVDPAVLTSQQTIYTAPTNINEFRAHSNMRLDYILLSESLNNKLTDYTVVKNSVTNEASDHYPVVVELL